MYFTGLSHRTRNRKRKLKCVERGHWTPATKSQDTVEIQKLDFKLLYNIRLDILICMACHMRAGRFGGCSSTLRSAISYDPVECWSMLDFRGAGGSRVTLLVDAC
jgi:hypothetical protein